MPLARNVQELYEYTCKSYRKSKEKICKIFLQKFKKLKN